MRVLREAESDPEQTEIVILPSRQDEDEDGADDVGEKAGHSGDYTRFRVCHELASITTICNIERGNPANT